MNPRSMSAVVALAMMALAATSNAQEMRPTITVATAKKMADACEAKAKAEGWKMIIAVVDYGGNLKYFLRMDGAFPGSIKIAQLRANTAAAFSASTRQLDEVAQNNVLGLVHVPGFLMI